MLSLIREYACVIVGICVFGVGMVMWLVFKFVLVGVLCNLWRIIRHLGSRSLVISWLQMSGLGL